MFDVCVLDVPKIADANFSTLEAVNPSFEPFRKEKPLPADSGKQVISEDGGKQVVVPYSDIEVNAQHQPTQQYPVENYLEPPIVEEGKTRRTRKWLWIGIAVLLVVILAAVLGGVWDRGRAKRNRPLQPQHRLQMRQHQVKISLLRIRSLPSRTNPTVSTTLGSTI